MGFAIPISDASDVIQNLMNKEPRSKVSDEERGYIGIKGYDVSEEGSQMYNMPTGVYAVSYTHLDVYKRQLYQFSVKSMEQSS